MPSASRPLVLAMADKKPKKKVDSAVKRAKQSEARRIYNKSRKTEISTRMKKVSLASSPAHHVCPWHTEGPCPGACSGPAASVPREAGGLRGCHKPRMISTWSYCHCHESACMACAKGWWWHWWLAYMEPAGVQGA